MTLVQKQLNWIMALKPKCFFQNVLLPNGHTFYESWSLGSAIWMDNKLVSVLKIAHV